MSASPAAAAALDVLLQQRRILPGDHRAGVEFAFLAARRHRRFYRVAFVAAVDVLDRSGGRTMVEAVVLDDQAPRTPAGMARIADGLHALHAHFDAEGML